MKILILGFGSIGRRHFRNLLSLGERDISFFRTGQSTLDDAELEGFPVYRDIPTALAQHPQAVIVANPTSHHLASALPAAKQGCHIFLEKPISHNRDQVADFIQAVNASGSRVLVGYQFRFHPNLIRVKELLEEGRIGQPLAVRSHWGEYLPGWHPWEDYRKGYSARQDLGGGVLTTLSHNFDYLRWLFGDLTVSASLLGYRGGLGIDVEDTAEVLLQAQDGLIISLHLNYLQVPPRHTLEIVGTTGVIHWDYYQNEVELLERKEDGQFARHEYPCPDDFERNHLFLAEMGHFLDVVKGKTLPLCSLEDGLKALDLILAARKADKGRVQQG